MREAADHAHAHDDEDRAGDVGEAERQAHDDQVGGGRYHFVLIHGSRNPGPPGLWFDPAEWAFLVIRAVSETVRFYHPLGGPQRAPLHAVYVPVLRRRNRPARRPPDAAAHLSKPVIRIADEGALRSAGRGRPMVRIETYRPSRAGARVPRRKRGRPISTRLPVWKRRRSELVALARAIRLQSRRR